MTNIWYVKNILANCDGNIYLPILHLSRVDIALRVARKIAPCDRAFIPTDPLMRLLKPEIPKKISRDYRRHRVKTVCITRVSLFLTQNHTIQQKIITFRAVGLFLNVL